MIAVVLHQKSSAFSASGDRMMDTDQFLYLSESAFFLTIIQIQKSVLFLVKQTLKKHCEVSLLDQNFVTFHRQTFHTKGNKICDKILLCPITFGKISHLALVFLFQLIYDTVLPTTHYFICARYEPELWQRVKQYS